MPLPPTEKPPSRHCNSGQSTSRSRSCLWSPLLANEGVATKEAHQFPTDSAIHGSFCKPITSSILVPRRNGTLRQMTLPFTAYRARKLGDDIWTTLRSRKYDITQAEDMTSLIRQGCAGSALKTQRNLELSQEFLFFFFWLGWLLVFIIVFPPWIWGLRYMVTYRLMGSIGRVPLNS